jgi:hypothetical protein
MNSPKNGWVEVTRDDPCLACDKDSYCSYSASKTVIICRRRPGGQPRVDKNGEQYYLYPFDYPFSQEDLAKPPRSGDEAKGGKLREVFPSPEKVERAPDDVLDAAYQVIFTGTVEAKNVEGGQVPWCGLGKYHVEKMLGRGLSEEFLRRKRYVTAPYSGVRYEVAQAVAQKVGEEMAKRVPGLFKEKLKDGSERWNLNAVPNSVWIPVRNLKKQIVAVKVRHDDPYQVAQDNKQYTQKKYYSKYTWLSSADKGGAGSGSPVHIPYFTGSTEIIRITEGELKADVATNKTNLLTIAIPGVSTWNRALPVVEALKSRRVLIALDMDANTNEAVSRAIYDLTRALEAKKIEVVLETWDPEFKGIDDYLCKSLPIWVETPNPVSMEVERVLRLDKTTLREGEALWPAIMKIIGEAKEYQKKRRTSLDNLENPVEEPPLPPLPEEVAQVLKKYLPEFGQTWLENPNETKALAISYGAILSQNGIDPGMAGRIVSVIAGEGTERDPNFFGEIAKNSAIDNQRQAVSSIKKGFLKISKQLNTTVNNFLKELTETVKPEVLKGISEWLEDYDLVNGRYYSKEKEEEIFKLMTNKPWVIAIEASISQLLRRRFAAQEIRNLPGAKEKQLKAFFNCGTLARIFNHAECGAMEFGGLMLCNGVSCIECRSQVAFLAREYVKSPSFGNWPEAIVIFETRVRREKGELVASREEVRKVLDRRNLGLQMAGFSDSNPRTVLETRELQSFMAVDPEMGEQEHLRRLRLMPDCQNVRIRDKPSAIDIYESSLTQVSRSVAKLFTNITLDDYYHPDPVLQQLAQEKLLEITKIVNGILGRKFVFGGRKYTLPSGTGSYNRATVRRKYDLKKDQIDPDIFSPKRFSKEEMFFADGCKCQSTSFIDAIHGTEHLKVTGYQNEVQDYAMHNFYAYAEGFIQADLIGYATPAAMKRTNAEHRANLPRILRAWTALDPPMVEMASL